MRGWEGWTYASVTHIEPWTFPVKCSNPPDVDSRETDMLGSWNRSIGGLRSNVLGVEEVDASCSSCVILGGGEVKGDNMV